MTWSQGGTAENANIGLVGPSHLEEIAGEATYLETAGDGLQGSSVTSVREGAGPRLLKPLSTQLQLTSQDSKPNGYNIAM